MFFSLDLLLLSLPFMASYVVAQSSPLKFVYPEPGKFNYELADGDKAIVEWTPKTVLATVLLNCSSSAMLNGVTDSEVEFINANSGVLYHVRQTGDAGKKGDRYCAFCAESDPQTCSGVFRLLPRKEGAEPKVWTSIVPGTSFLSPRTSYEKPPPAGPKKDCATLKPTPKKNSTYSNPPPSLPNPLFNPYSKPPPQETPKLTIPPPSDNQKPAPKGSPSPTIPPNLYNPTGKPSPKETPIPKAQPPSYNPYSKPPPKGNSSPTDKPSPKGNPSKPPPKDTPYPTQPPTNPPPKDKNPPFTPNACPIPPRPAGSRNTSLPLITPTHYPPAASLPPFTTYPITAPCPTSPPEKGAVPTPPTPVKYNRTETRTYASTLTLNITPTDTNRPSVDGGEGLSGGERLPTTSSARPPPTTRPGSNTGERLPTASPVRPTPAPIEQTGVGWRGSVDWGMMELGVLAVGVFVWL